MRPQALAEFTLDSFEFDILNRSFAIFIPIDDFISQIIYSDTTYPREEKVSLYFVHFARKEDLFNTY